MAAAVDCVPVAFADTAVLVGQPAVEPEDQGQGVFGDVDGIGAAIIGHRHAEFGAEIEVHMLIAGAQ